MSVIKFPAGPYPLLAIGQSKTSGFAKKLWSPEQLSAIANEGDLLSVSFQGIAKEDDPPEEVARVLDRLILDLDACLGAVGRRVFDYDLEAKDGRIDLFVLVKQRSVTGTNPSSEPGETDPQK